MLKLNLCGFFFGLFFEKMRKAENLIVGYHCGEEGSVLFDSGLIYLF